MITFMVELLAFITTIVTNPFILTISMVEQLAVITTIATNPHDGKGSSADALKNNEKNV